MSKDIERECTKKCESQVHGLEIVAAITKRAVSDHAIASYIKRLCYNFNNVCDYQGRTAIHMAAAQGRTVLLEWLIQNSSESMINAKDKESGYTALHKSIYHGQIGSAVKLLQLGVNTEIVDYDGYTAMDLATFDRGFIRASLQDNLDPQNVGIPCEAYAWGSNANYTLGIGAKPRKIPDVISFFNKLSTQVKQVSLSKYHTVFLTADGRVWACGQIGRAGADIETSIQPIELKLPDKCVSVGALIDSTVYRLKNGKIFHYVLNNEATLNPSKKTPSSITLPVIKPIIKAYTAVGLRTSRVHAAVWTLQNVYIWGENNGQMGLPRGDRYVRQPNKISFPSVGLVATSEAATVIYSGSTVTLLHQYQTRKILSRLSNLKQMCVQSKVTESGGYTRVTIILVTWVPGCLEIWQDGVKNLHKVTFRLSRRIIVDHALLLNETLYFTTVEGEAYAASIPTLKPTNGKRDENPPTIPMKTTRLPNLHRALLLFGDDEELNFACVQVKPEFGLPVGVKEIHSSMETDLRAFLAQATVDDLIHDFVFKIGSRVYPAHIYIVAQESAYVYDWFRERKKAEPDVIPVLELNDTFPEVLDQILAFIYTGICSVLLPDNNNMRIKKDVDYSGCEEVIELRAEILAHADGKSVRKRARNRHKIDKNVYYDPIKLVLTAALKLKVVNLSKRLEKYQYDEQLDTIETTLPVCCLIPEFNRDNMQDLCDAFLTSKDGTLIPVHKCILAARLQYFNSMFTYSFRESKNKCMINLPIQYNILIVILKYLYADDCAEIETSDSIDFLCSALIAADLIIAERLFQKCEISLIKLVKLKNCTELLHIAQTYNAKNLKRYCYKFISYNLVQILELHTLDGLDDSLLKELSEAYAEFNPVMGYRIITPFPGAVSDQIINEVHKNFTVDLNAKLEVPKSDGVRNDNCRSGGFQKGKKDKKANELQCNPTDLSSPDQSVVSEVVQSPKKAAEAKIENKWVEVPTAQQKIVLARLRAINSAKDIQNEVQPESFVKLPSSPPESPSKARLSQSPVDTEFVPPKSSQGNITISHIGPKLSQKQRKKLAQQNGASLPEDVNKLTLNSPPAPVNPWKISEQPQPSCSLDSKLVPQTLQFNEILADQKRQKDNSSRIMSKPLHLTQLEDRAIEELEKFYNVHESDEEFITVQRVHVPLSAPQWVHNSPK